MSEQECNKLSDSEQKKEDWMNSKWRPLMGYVYMVTCLFDFIIAPILWSLVQAFFHGGVNVQWQPLTLQGAGLYHIAMGAVLGLAAYGRTQEKLNGANNGGISLPAGVGTTYTAPTPIQSPATPAVPASVPPVTNSWGSQPLASGSGFGSAPAPDPAPSFTPKVTQQFSSSGKPLGPPAATFPAI